MHSDTCSCVCIRAKPTSCTTNALPFAFALPTLHVHHQLRALDTLHALQTLRPLHALHALPALHELHPLRGNRTLYRAMHATDTIHTRINEMHNDTCSSICIRAKHTTCSTRASRIHALHTLQTLHSLHVNCTLYRAIHATDMIDTRIHEMRVRAQSYTRTPPTYTHAARIHAHALRLFMGSYAGGTTGISIQTDTRAGHSATRMRMQQGGGSIPMTPM